MTVGRQVHRERYRAVWLPKPLTRMHWATTRTRLKPADLAHPLRGISFARFSSRTSRAPSAAPARRSSARLAPPDPSPPAAPTFAASPPCSLSCRRLVLVLLLQHQPDRPLTHSGENLLGRPMIPSSQLMEPPGIPGRFRGVGDRSGDRWARPTHERRPRGHHAAT